MDTNPTDRETLQLRDAFARFVLSIPETYISKFSPETAALFAELYVKKVRFNVTYDAHTEKVLAFITSIMA